MRLMINLQSFIQNIMKLISIGNRLISCLTALTLLTLTLIPPCNQETPLLADVVFVTVSHRAIARCLCRLFLLAAVIMGNRWCDHEFVIIATAFLFLQTYNHSASRKGSDWFIE